MCAPVYSMQRRGHAAMQQRLGHELRGCGRMCRTGVQEPQEQRPASPEPVEEEEEQLPKLPSFEQFEGCYASIAQAMLRPVPGNVSLPLLQACWTWYMDHAPCLPQLSMLNDQRGHWLIPDTRIGISGAWPINRMTAEPLKG